MIEVEVFTGTYGGSWRRAALAEAEDPESAVYAARILWDEASTQVQGQRRRVNFRVDGRLVRVFERRP